MVFRSYIRAFLNEIALENYEHNWLMYPDVHSDILRYIKYGVPYLAYEPDAMIKDVGKQRGMWIPSSSIYKKGNRGIVVMDVENQEFVINTNLRDPRVATIILSTLNVMPEFSDWDIVVWGEFDEDVWKSKKIIKGKAGDYRDNAKEIVSNFREWSKDENISYKEFKYMVFEDLDDITWFHATRLSNLQSIMKKGLLTSKSFEQGGGWTQLNLNLQDAVYLTSNEDYAYQIAETLLGRFDEPAIVIKVSGKALKDKDKLVVDEDVMTSEFDGMMAPGMLEPGLPDALSSVIHRIESIGYSGNIPPNLIKPEGVIYWDEKDEEIHIVDYQTFKNKIF